jgi:mRNA interferase RelE/StbE
MPHRTEVASAAAKDLARLPRDLLASVRGAIDSLSDQPRPHDSAKPRPNGPHRIRIGDYRVLYDVDDAQRVVTILRVRHRRDAYRGR